MGYLYSICFGLLVALGIYILSNGMQILGIVSIGIGSLCLIINIFGKRIRFGIFMLSLITVVIVCTLVGILPVSAIKDKVFTAIENIQVDTNNSHHTNIAEVQGIWASPIWIGGGKLYVELIPNESAEANEVYIVELYEKSKLRSVSKVSWSQPEINVATMRPVIFPITRAEAETYSDFNLQKDLMDIFSVKIHE